ncbi:hypothetical protein [Enterococcus hirae]|uniref:hypothetical protein n=1 Tax=Enterococcus hirae TaxID=1354 RepID=UPI001361C2A0|nr:hypothetical protein [Enterococcus hirae]MDD9146215.1 hypothetical protein [Enterococcus hirae]MEB5733657.1 hypothetical protein [Enterococcus hirae]MEC4729516.1 hypothetical protein [Enterococcus hirae]NAA11652.1 hypothetical protein [Enterococcus hirae]NAA17956.1 hypothetical protein [Enterococcus hirae]
MKEAVSSDDNKKEFFETASHVLKNSGLLPSNCFTPMIHFVPIYDRRTKCRSEILDKN